MIPSRRQDPSPRVAVSQISVDDLAPGQYQPRTKMHKSTLEELAQSIKEQGVLQPLVVRRLASGRFEIVVGSEDGEQLSLQASVQFRQ